MCKNPGVKIVLIGKNNLNVIFVVQLVYTVYGIGDKYHKRYVLHTNRGYVLLCRKTLIITY